MKIHNKITKTEDLKFNSHLNYGKGKSPLVDRFIWTHYIIRITVTEPDFNRISSEWRIDTRLVIRELK